MFSEALYIMDRNTERLMVEELREEMATKMAAVREEAAAKVAAAKAEAKIETNIFRLRLLGKAEDEIAEELKISLDMVQKTLNSLEQ